MRVVLISDAESAGGACIAASRLAAGLIGLGHSVTRVVFVPDGRRNPWATVADPAPRPLQRLARAAHRASFLPLPVRLLARRAARWMGRVLDRLRPDVVNVHNLHGAEKYGWTTDLVDLAAARAPVVWTLHDMWSFTGRCAYSGECRLFLRGCDASCPTPREYPDLHPSRIAAAWRSRRALLDRLPDLVGVAPSRWLVRESSEGLWRGRRVLRIPYGLPLDVFRPIPREEARRALDPLPDGPVALVSANDLSERRKGVPILEEALRRVPHLPLTILAVGKGTLAVPPGGRVRVVPLGFVADEGRRILLTNAADFSIHPAPVDNLPLAVMESIACGRPVLAFRTGGLPDLVRPGVTGWLVDRPSPADLAETLKAVVDGHGRDPDLSSRCRRVAEEEYGMDRQARAYETLFRDLRAARTATKPQ